MELEEEVQSDESDVEIIEKEKPRDITISDLWIVFMITFFSFSSRIFGIQNPRLPTVQERYYGSILNHAINSGDVLRCESPFGVMVMTALATICGYKGDIDFSTEYEGHEYLNLRSIGACCSGVVPVLAYLSLRWMRMRKNVAFTTALMMLCETSLISEARLISIEGIYQLILVVSIILVMFTGSFVYRSGLWWTTILLSGVAIGCLFATKFSGLCIVPFVLAYEFSSLRKQFSKEQLPGQEHVPTRRVFPRALFATFLMLAPALVVFFLIMAFYVSVFSVSPVSGILPTIQKLVKTAEMIEKGNQFSANLFLLPLGAAKMHVMWRDGNSLCATHIHYINCILGSSSAVACLGFWLFSRRFGTRTNSRVTQALPFAIGHLSFYIGLFFVHGPVYGSDYASSLIFGLFCFGYCLHSLLKDVQFVQGLFATLSQFAVLSAFILWCPWAYGITGGDIASRVWFASWIEL